MAKRFTDTEKWKREWFADLCPMAKLTWLYILDNVDHCGVWHRNFKRMSLDIGAPITEGQFAEWFQRKFIQFEEDKYWFPSFIEFQQKQPLNPANKSHKPIIEFLTKHNFLNKFSVETKGLESPYEAPKKGLLSSPGKGVVNVFDSSSQEEGQSDPAMPPSPPPPGMPVVKTEDLGELIIALQGTYDHFRIRRDARMDAMQLARLITMYKRPPEDLRDAIIGYRHEQKTETYDPAKNFRLSRLQELKPYEKLRNLGAQAEELTPKRWKRTTDAV